jgi:hypothetical protein
MEPFLKSNGDERYMANAIDCDAPMLTGVIDRDWDL